MRMPKLQELAAVASLVVRAMRVGAPPAVSTPERLANIPTIAWPVHMPVTIHWDAHQIPSIEAANEDDLAVGLGAVHAHLRLAQMEAMRRLAHGRVSEVVGPAGLEIDRALRLMRFGAAVPAMEAALPDPTRRWLQGFIAGVNHHILHAPALPHEFTLLGFRPEPWTLAELLTVTRLASTDVSWLVFARLLKSQAKLPAEEWAALWPEMLAGDALPWPARAEEATLGLFRGSNSAAVPAAHSQTGAALIASDPHLSIALPPLWVVAGLHAPGFQAVGLDESPASPSWASAATPGSPGAAPACTPPPATWWTSRPSPSPNGASKSASRDSRPPALSCARPGSAPWSATAC